MIHCNNIGCDRIIGSRCFNLGPSSGGFVSFVDCVRGFVERQVVTVAGGPPTGGGPVAPAPGAGTSTFIAELLLADVEFDDSAVSFDC